MRTSERKRGFTAVELLGVLFAISLLAALVLPAIVLTRDKARSAICMHNMAQLGLALHGYHHTHNVLPPGSVNSSGPVVDDATSYNFGWLAQLLPHFDEGIAFRRLDFTRSVYAKENLAAGQTRSRILVCPSSVIRSPLISYAACHHGSEVPIDSDNHGVMFLNSSVRFRDITDGRRSTIMLGETKDGFPYLPGTRATLRNTGSVINQDIDSRVYRSQSNRSYYSESHLTPEIAQPVVAGQQIDPRLYVGGFRSDHKGGANFCFADGAVKFLSSRIDTQVYQNLGNRMDGNLIENY